MGVYIPIKDYSAMQGPAPDGFHVPSKDEWVALCGILTTTFSMAANDKTMGIYLKMPMAGYRKSSDASVSNEGLRGFYWSSTSSTGGVNNSYCLRFFSSYQNTQYLSYRSYGYPIRCFKDVSVIPTSSWTTLYDGSSIASGAGVFYNASLGFISVSGDGQTWYTIQDKNLGATTVFNQGDTVNDANSGYFYQWGNNYGFAHSGSVTTSSTRVSASNYGPGNYYSSSTFITYDGAWDTTNNHNLWGGVTGVKPMSELKNAYIGEYVEETFTLTDVPNTNTNKYISIAKSGYVVNSVVFEFTSVGTTNSNNDCYFRISSTNSSVNRYGGGVLYKQSGNTLNVFRVLGRLNNASDTMFRENTSLISGSGTNTVRLAFDRNSGSYTINGTTTTWTHGTSEKNIVETIMNSSTINAYASRQGGATIDNITITITYEPN